MRQQLGLGSAVGAVVSLLCWRGNQTRHLVSTFPDVVTFLMLVVLLSVAVWFDQRGRDRAPALRAGLTIASAAGVVFGSTVAVLGTLQFTQLTVGLLAFGFLTALGSSLIVGSAAALALSRRRHARVRPTYY